jgi:hypothetical protein
LLGGDSEFGYFIEDVEGTLYDEDTVREAQRKEI